MTFKSAALVPGLPHVLQGDLNPTYAALARAVGQLGDNLAAQGIKRIVYYSTGWISVLGHLYQARPELGGVHVDENWHELGDLPFDFKVDSVFAMQLAAKAEAAGYQTQLVNYEGFPVDTGTIVADRLLNKGRFQTNMVSCCVYSDFADTVKLAGTVASAMAADSVPTAVVAVTMLSGRFFTGEMDLREDQVRDPGDDRWNRKMLDLLTAARWDEAVQETPAYAAQCKVDMGFKALAFLKGVGALKPGQKAKELGYGGIYGTGAAVLEF